MTDGAWAVALGSYPHTARLIAGEVASPALPLAFERVAPISKAFAPMVREARFDASEMAIATFLMARAWDKPLVLLPAVVARRFQEGSMLCRADGPVRRPEDLAGRRIGVRAYSQTTGMWLRGVLAEAHGVRSQDCRWVTFEDAHVPEYRDPPWAERAAKGADMLAMLKAGELDAAIFGNDVPADPALRTVWPDVPAAGRAFQARHGFEPVNHLVVVRREHAERSPARVAELLRLLREAGVPALTRADLAPALGLAARWCADQGLLPGPMAPEQAWAGLPEGIG
ncbi:ABC transporter substrate-binding protein [Falsiroseomonas sp. CW058]|uniref:ABC transporter substrate-binding protein n=1 Tax=Falsiroseomonas sp. CW058 TaxID=3388664 RepID=UPI003D315935